MSLTLVHGVDTPCLERVEVAMPATPNPSFTAVFTPSTETVARPSSLSPTGDRPGLFPQKIWDEFITSSGIHPNIFTATTEFHHDLETLPGSDPSSPIHDALNWNYTRFGFTTNPPLEAIFFKNEDGSVWQLKLDEPIVGKNGKTRKYETPKGQGSRAFLPVIPPSMRELIGQRYGVEVPLTGSFWDWVADHPELGIIVTEGGKKSLSLLSQGYIAIALYGVNGGYRCVGELRELINDWVPFVGDDRPITLAFDQDTKSSTRSKVKTALDRFGYLLEASDCKVFVATWSPSQGKGVDDLIVQSGVDAWHRVYGEAVSFQDWRILRRFEGRLTYAPWIRLNVPDLSQIEIEGLPESGFIALVSPKGSGKTKFIARMVDGEDATIGLGHRVCLGQELARRWNLHYRGDLDKVQGNFITGSAYVFRVWSCFDSLLAIDPNKFAGCDLVLDEVVQGIRHLLTSETCQKQGKLPALLARFRQLVRSARRIIVADADLCDWCIDYLQTLRGDGQPCFLIENTYAPEGYTASIVDSPNPSPVVAQLLQDIEKGHRLFVATDSKRESQVIAKHCDKIGASYLLINSETSGEQEQKAFIANPDQFLKSAQSVQVVIASPSLGTGTSIESDYFNKVYGIFRGTSITHEDVAQALLRVRALIPRVIWCATKGRAYSKISNSVYPAGVEQDWKERSDAQVAILKAQVAPEMMETAEGLDWESNPEVKALTNIEADRNWSMVNFQQALRLKLMEEGHQVFLHIAESDDVVKAKSQAARQDIKDSHAKAILDARVIDGIEAEALGQQECLAPVDRLALQRFQLCEFYVLQPDELSLDLVLADADGMRRGKILNLEAFLSEEVAIAHDALALEQMDRWNQGLCPWHLPGSLLRRKVRLLLGLDRFLVPGYTWTVMDLKELGKLARRHGKQIKSLLNFTVSKNVSNAQIAHQLLSQMGIKVQIFTTSRTVPGQKGKRVKYFRLDQEVYQDLLTILQRRANQQQGDSALFPGLPSPLIDLIRGGKPDSISSEIGDLTVLIDPSEQKNLPLKEGKGEKLSFLEEEREPITGQPTLIEIKQTLD